MDHYIATVTLLTELLKLAGILGGPLVAYWVARRLARGSREEP